MLEAEWFSVFLFIKFLLEKIYQKFIVEGTKKVYNQTINYFSKGEIEMAFFDKATETFNNVSKDVVDKAKEIKELVSLNNQVASQETLVNKYYRELGQFVYENRGEDIAEPVEEKIALIDAAYEEIARLKKDLMKKKGLKVCPNCGHEMAKDDAFCSKCGTPAPVEEEPAEEAAEETAEVKECGCETAEEECGCEEKPETCGCDKTE